MDALREVRQKAQKENSFLTYGGNGVRHMGTRGCVGDLKIKGTPRTDFFFLSTRLSPDEMNERDLKNMLDQVLFPICRTPFPPYVRN